MSPVKEWPTILITLEQRLSQATVKTWFYKAELLRDENNNLEIRFPKIFFLERVKSHYLEDLKQVLQESLGIEHVNIELTVKKAETGSLGPLFDPNELPKKEGLTADAQEAEKDSTNIPAPRQPATEPGPQNRPSPSPSLRSVAFGLSPFYTFDEFIVGPNNQLAYSVALSIAESPGQSYNPFFLYASTGLGKTHLMQAVGNEILRKFPQAKVVYTTGEAFTNELLEAIQHRSQKRFRDKFRNTDALLIDDVQFVAGKEATQEELFHAFNELYLVRKQIILTSDRPPRDIPLLSDRLRSRFAGGMTADIQTPDEVVRAAILRNKRDRGSFNVSNEVIDFIASQVKTSIREMEGVFLQIVSIGKTRGQEISLDLATEILSHNSLLSKKQLPTPKRVMEEVTAVFNISHKDLVGPRRTKGLVLPRQICMYLLRNTCRLPLMSIGEVLGGRDHTTIMHGVDRIEEDIKNEEENVVQKVNLLNLKICG